MIEANFSKRTDLVWLAGMTMGLVFTIIAGYVTPYPEFNAGQVFVYAAVSRILLYLAAGGQEDMRIYQELALMGVVVGFVELLADYWLINGISSGQLVYHPHNDVVACQSPIWMPIAWACVTVEFGYLILRLDNMLGKPWLASLLGAVIAGVGVGMYEYLANAAGWWYYEKARAMIGGFCALYIPLGEVFMFLCFYTLFKKTRFILSLQTRVIVSGAIFGLVIFASYAAAYFLLEVR